MNARIAVSNGDTHYVRESPYDIDELWRRPGSAWLVLHDYESGAQLALQRVHIVSIEPYGEADE